MIPKIFAADSKIIPNTSGSTVPEILANIVGYLLWFVGAIALIFVIYGGILFMMSSGDPEKVAIAKKTLARAVIGIIIVVLSYTIVVSLRVILSNFF